jgi:hypothetical protein
MPHSLLYKIVTYDLPDSGSELNLDRYARDHWKVVQMIPTPDGKRIVLLLEKPAKTA